MRAVRRIQAGSQRIKPLARTILFMEVLERSVNQVNLLMPVVDELSVRLMSTLEGTSHGKGSEEA